MSEMPHVDSQSVVFAAFRFDCDIGSLPLAQQHHVRHFPLDLFELISRISFVGDLWIDRRRFGPLARNGAVSAVAEPG
ncbi:hypothetical protein [Povalibacter sp.]|uniref:hypothetical protein n=1 Tax=Povalibacter sp. TaxID=1962978 RepID=UPI002F40B206